MIFVIQNNSHYLCAVKSLKIETGKMEITNHITKLKTYEQVIIYPCGTGHDYRGVRIKQEH